MDHDDEFTLTLQTAREPNQLRRIFSTQRLARYINRSDGALAQARVAFRDVEPRCRSRLCNASFALVNSWYRPLRPHLMKRNIREKAVGKITVSLFFLPAKAGALAYPTNLQGCEQIVNMQRYYRTCWQSGCMFQKGADLKFWKKRFFRLKGWRLFSYTEAREARAMIDLSKASALVADHRVISHRSWQPHGSTEVTISPVKNSFHVVFENGEKIEFFCDSARERGRWLDVLKIAVDCQLQWPGWVSPEDDEADEDEDLHPAVDYGPVKDQEVPVAAI
ncbi:hypothetical protein BCR43DRAFT_332048 [Syncephalastrum racemosum]|uniref:PH domain-containing protein n=1 Tax=Syncephalastrum racemosum TaxID=13706 RepID=A0A1X2H850_SYNRA|nr:hypothetical protein BCR43DRAFT_332048 [Syncephalastrum racemosum]